MTVTPITSFAEFESIRDSGKVIVIDFWATWCGPCRVISPVFEKLAKKTEGIEFYKVDVDEQTEIAQYCDIRAMPTFLLFKNGEKVADVTGAIPTALTNMIELHASHADA